MCTCTHVYRPSNPQGTKSNWKLLILRKGNSRDMFAVSFTRCLLKILQWKYACAPEVFKISTLFLKRQTQLLFSILEKSREPVECSISPAIRRGDLEGPEVHPPEHRQIPACLRWKVMKTPDLLQAETLETSTGNYFCNLQEMYGSSLSDSVWRKPANFLSSTDSHVNTVTCWHFIVN